MKVFQLDVDDVSLLVVAVHFLVMLFGLRLTSFFPLQPPVLVRLGPSHLEYREFNFLRPHFLARRPQNSLPLPLPAIGPVTAISAGSAASFYFIFQKTDLDLDEQTKFQRNGYHARDLICY